MSTTNTDIEIETKQGGSFRASRHITTITSQIPMAKTNEIVNYFFRKRSKKAFCDETADVKITCGATYTDQTFSFGVHREFFENARYLWLESENAADDVTEITITPGPSVQNDLQLALFSFVLREMLRSYYPDQSPLNPADVVKKFFRSLVETTPTAPTSDYFFSTGDTQQECTLVLPAALCNAEADFPVPSLSDGTQAHMTAYGWMYAMEIAEELGDLLMLTTLTMLFSRATYLPQFYDDSMGVLFPSTPSPPCIQTWLARSVLYRVLDEIVPFPFQLTAHVPRSDGRNAGEVKLSMPVSSYFGTAGNAIASASLSDAHREVVTLPLIPLMATVHGRKYPASYGAKGVMSARFTPAIAQTAASILGVFLGPEADLPAFVQRHLADIMMYGMHDLPEVLIFLSAATGFRFTERVQELACTANPSDFSVRTHVARCLGDWAHVDPQLPQKFAVKIIQSQAYAERFMINLTRPYNSVVQIDHVAYNETISCIREASEETASVFPEPTAASCDIIPAHWSKLAHRASTATPYARLSRNAAWTERGIPAHIKIPRIEEAASPDFEPEEYANQTVAVVTNTILDAIYCVTETRKKTAWLVASIRKFVEPLWILNQDMTEDAAIGHFSWHIDANTPGHEAIVLSPRIGTGLTRGTDPTPLPYHITHGEFKESGTVLSHLTAPELDSIGHTIGHDASFEEISNGRGPGGRTFVVGSKAEDADTVAHMMLKFLKI